MKHKIQQFVALTLILSFVLGGALFIAPKKTHADISFDPFNFVVNTLSSIATDASSLYNEFSSIETPILKDIALAIAKQILQQLTLSVVDWINHGFNGSPAFVSNPAQYFQNLGDNIAGNFLQQNGDLKFLCSPFSLDVRIALAVKMTNPIQNQYTCTLSSAIQNATNAANGASITGFMQGDFNQGGFPAFLTLTTDPQNNAGGAFLKAESDLTNKINTKVTQKTNELAQGLGFMSSETCNYSQTSDTGSVTNLTQKQFDALQANNNEENDANLNEVCQTTTPGSVISSILNKHLGVPTDELELAQDLNAIISAAFSALVLQVFNGGLGSVTAAPSSAGGTSYLQSLASQSNAQLQSTQAGFIQQLSPQLNTAQNYKANVDTALGIATGTQANLNAAINCWSQFTATSSQYKIAQNNILQLQTTNSNQLAPIIASLTTQDSTAQSDVGAILNVENSINSAQTSSDLSNSSKQISSLQSSGNIITAADVQKSADQITTVTATTTPINTASQTSLQQCQTAISTYGL